jgi:hypothetical protein
MREEMVSLHRNDDGTYTFDDLSIESINARWYVFWTDLDGVTSPIADFSTLREVRQWIYYNVPVRG